MPTWAYGMVRPRDNNLQFLAQCTSQAAVSMIQINVDRINKRIFKIFPYFPELRY